MSLPSNKPGVDRLQRRLAGLPDTQLDAADPETLAEMLEVSIADVEDKTGTQFDGRSWTERYDGNGTNGLLLRRRPVTSVQLVKVELPVLALNRVYTPEEIKLYRDESFITIFTYKLGAEQVSLHIQDMGVHGNLFPPLPQCVQVDHTWGFPRYDPDRNITSYDGTETINGTQGQIGATVLAGDTRTPAEKAWVIKLREAAVLDAASSYLAQIATQAVGLLTAVSFDGYSQSMNPQAYGATVQAMVDRRDELMAFRKRGYWASTAT